MNFKKKQIKWKSISETFQKQHLVQTALLYLHAPYLWGGRITSGIDCSGFSQLIYRICGLEIDRDARQQALQGKKIDSSKINPGNLAFFGNSIKEITHVGIMLNKNEIIHAFGKIRIDIVNNEGIINLESKKLTRLFGSFFSNIYIYIIYIFSSINKTRRCGMPPN